MKYDKGTFSPYEGNKRRIVRVLKLAKGAKDGAACRRPGT